MRKVIKKQLEKASKRIGGEKNANDANDRINTINFDWNLELHRGNNFLRINIRSSRIHFQLGSSVQIFLVLAFEALLFTFSCMKLSLKLSLKLVEFMWEKVIILQLSKDAKNFVNATSIGSYFGKPTFYIGSCYYQLNQYGSY